MDKVLELELPGLRAEFAPAEDNGRENEAHAAAPEAMPAEIELQASQRIVLRCGQSSLTLYPNGKIVLRGQYILSEAEGVNRVAGGRIELN